MISGIFHSIIFAKESMINVMSPVSLRGILVWGNHVYIVGLESDTRAYVTGYISLQSILLRYHQQTMRSAGKKRFS